MGGAIAALSVALSCVTRPLLTSRARVWVCKACGSSLCAARLFMVQRTCRYTMDRVLLLGRNDSTHTFNAL